MYTIHVAELDSTGNFDTTFPLCLQGYLSPQEYQYVIHKGNEAEARNQKAKVRGTILLSTTMLIFFSINAGVAFLIAWAFHNIPVIIILAVIAQVVIIIILGALIAWITKKRQLSIIQEFKNELDLYNQTTLHQRGLKVRSRREGPSENESVYIEFLVCEKPNNNAIIQKREKQPQYSGYYYY